jgi:choline dehydrogenase-like flavoprotein
MRERARNLRSESEPHLNERCLFQLRGKVLGGTSSINSMVYMRGQPQVLADIHQGFWVTLTTIGWSATSGQEG